MKIEYCPPASLLASSLLPVCPQKASKFLEEPGSVESIFSICPASSFAIAFLARTIGRGQARSLASSSESKLSMKHLTVLFWLAAHHSLYELNRLCDSSDVNDYVKIRNKNVSFIALHKAPVFNRLQLY